MVRIGVCDDDVVLASKIELFLEKIGKRKLIDMEIDIFFNGNTLWEKIYNGSRYDLLYLDIKMEHLNGIETAKKIRELDQYVSIIYISGYESFLKELFEVEPFRFLKKPIDQALFEQYFDKFYSKILKEDIYFEYKFNKIVAKVCLKDIIYFESNGRMIHIVTKDNTEKFYGKLNQIEKKLNNSKFTFLRIHQSYLVNFQYIQKLSFSRIRLNNGTELQISEERQKKIRESYSELLGEL